MYITSFAALRWKRGRGIFDLGCMQVLACWFSRAQSTEHAAVMRFLSAIQKSHEYLCDVVYYGQVQQLRTVLEKKG